MKQVDFASFSLNKTQMIFSLNFKSFPSIIKTDDNGRVGNVLCAYSSLMYFKMKYGFHPILAAWQLDKIEKLQIQATEIILPSSLQIKWETVGVESEYPGRKSKKILHPDNLFLNNINDYRYNR